MTVPTTQEQHRAALEKALELDGTEHPNTLELLRQKIFSKFDFDDMRAFTALIDRAKSRYAERVTRG